MTVVLTMPADGSRIYNVTASCKEWNDSGATITIEQREGEFIVTNSLSDATSDR